MFNELGDSGSEVAKIIKEETGESFGQLMNDGYSWQMYSAYCMKVWIRTVKLS